LWVTLYARTHSLISDATACCCRGRLHVVKVVGRLCDLQLSNRLYHLATVLMCCKQWATPRVCPAPTVKFWSASHEASSMLNAWSHSKVQATKGSSVFHHPCLLQVLCQKKQSCAKHHIVSMLCAQRTMQRAASHKEAQTKPRCIHLQCMAVSLRSTIQSRSACMCQF
jgi:hypothetical protein